MEIGEDANGKEAQLRSGQEFTVTLVENPTTGYRWTVVEPLPLSVRIIGDRFVTGADKPGAPGVRRWQFTTQDQTGQGILRFRLARSWQSTDEGRAFEITLRVSK